MRIFCFLHALDPGGVEQVALRLCRAWCADGHDVSLFLGRHRGSLPADLAAMDVTIGHTGRLPIATVEDLWMALCLPGMIQQVRPDVVFCAGNTYAFSAMIARVRLGDRCPPIVAKISNDLRRLDMPPLMRSLYHRWCRMQGRTFTALVAIAPAMQPEIEDCATPRYPVTIVSDAVLSTSPVATHSLSARFGRKPKMGKHFLAVGRLEPQKNLGLMLEAFAQGAGVHDRLSIIGKGRLERRLVEQATTLGIIDRVHFMGHRTDVARWWGRADALLLTSHYEGMPAVVVEALAHGVPVIASACCASVQDMLRDPACGMLVTEQDAAAFAKALRNFDSSSFNPDAMRAAALPFTVADSASAYLELFRVASARRATSRGTDKYRDVHRRPAIAEKLAL